MKRKLGTFLQISRNFPKCWQAGEFLKSPRNLTIWRYFSSSLGKSDVTGTSLNFLENFPKCWKIGIFPKSSKNLTWLSFSPSLINWKFPEIPRTSMFTSENAGNLGTSKNIAKLGTSQNPLRF